MSTDPVYDTLERVAIHSFILKEAKRAGCGPRPPEVAKADYEQLQSDVVYLLNLMPGGNTSLNRKKLLRAVNEIAKSVKPKC